MTTISSLANSNEDELFLIDENERLSLCETLDRVLNKGAVVVGDVTISIAGVDLLHLSLQLVLSSIETARKHQIQFNQE